jgi:hypothetical protein
VTEDSSLTGRELQPGACSTFGWLPGRRVAVRCTSTPDISGRCLWCAGLPRRSGRMTSSWRRRDPASVRCVTSTARWPAARARLATRAEEVADRTYELSELLVDVLGVDDVGAYFPHRVHLPPACHSLRIIRVDDESLRLVRRVRAMKPVELPDAEQCCGFGGTLAIKKLRRSRDFARRRWPFGQFDLTWAGGYLG